MEASEKDGQVLIKIIQSIFFLNDVFQREYFEGNGTYSTVRAPTKNMRSVRISIFLFLPAAKPSGSRAV